MGSSSSNSSSSTSTKYGASSQSNPFFTSATDKKGNTTVNFAKGTAGQQAFNNVNRDFNGVYNEMMTPNLNSTINQAKMGAFTKNLNDTSTQSLNNNIINPLQQTNMLRSSQATNMYNNLGNQMNSSIADYGNQLIQNSRSEATDLLNQLMTIYTNAYTGINNQQDASIQSSLGGATKKTSSNGKAG